MLSPSDALKIVLECVPQLPQESVKYANAFGRVLQEPIKADRPLPPFNRVMMDGIALKFESIEKGKHTLEIAGTQHAGEQALILENDSSCIEIMTGAVLPEGADCVVPVEQLKVEGSTVSIEDSQSIKPKQFIHWEGSDYADGAELVFPGALLTSRQLAVAASSGYEALTVSQLPKVAVISTGDELVDIAETPSPYQIRRSNSHSLVAGLAALGIKDASNYHFKDDETTLSQNLAEIIEQCDVVLLSGGVSKGKKDFLPSVLEKLGVEKKFQWVKQRPGKPFWFGQKKGGKQVVFALPGNPLSTLVCFHRYVKPALEKMLGLCPPAEQWVRLKTPFQFTPPLTCFLPVSLEYDTECYRSAVPSPVSNSGDYASVVNTEGFIELPDLLSEYPEGFSARFFPWI